MGLQSRQLWLFLAVFIFGLYARAVDPTALLGLGVNLATYAELVKAQVKRAKEETDPEKKKKEEDTAREMLKTLADLTAAEKSVENRADRDTSSPGHPGAEGTNSIPRSELESMKNGPTTPTTADTSGLPTASESQPIAPVEASTPESPTTGNAHSETASAGAANSPPAPQTESSGSQTPPAKAQTPEEQLREWVTKHPHTEKIRDNLMTQANNEGLANAQETVDQKLNQHIDKTVAEILARDGWREALSKKLAAQAPSEPTRPPASDSVFNLFKKAAATTAGLGSDVFEGMRGLGQGAVDGMKEIKIDPRKAAAALFNDPAFKNDVLQQTHSAVKGEVFASANQQADLRAPPKARRQGLINKIAHNKANQQAANVLPQVSQVAQSAVSDAFNNKAPTPPSGNFRGMPSRIMNSNRQWVNNPTLSKASVYNQAYNDAVIRILSGK